MMVRYFIVFTILLIAPFHLMAQQCKCADEFLFLKADIERNYVGFKDKVRADNRSSYNTLSQDIWQRARSATTQVYCLGLMKEWVAYFKDGHTGVFKNEVPFPIGAVETLPITPEKLLSLKARKGIEGIYYNTDSTYKIAIISNKTAFMDYAGVVLRSKAPEWKTGQVKLELRQITGGSLLAYAYSRDHGVQIRNFEFDGKSFNAGEWKKEGVAIGQHGDSNAADIQKMAQSPVQSRKISDKTFYVSIGSFEVSNIRAIDSVFETNENILRSTPNLVLDVRNNSGGGDESSRAIIPWLYTNPIYFVGVDEWSSEDNIRRWGNFLHDSTIPSQVKEEIKRLIVRLQSKVGHMVNMGENDTITLEKTEPYPQKVAILIDGQCASATEEFLLKALQSKKVTLLGQPTKGVLDYSNELVAPFPCMPFLFNYATSRSRRLDTGNGIDNIGIQPNIRLTDDQNWIAAAVKILEKE